MNVKLLSRLKRSYNQVKGGVAPYFKCTPSTSEISGTKLVMTLLVKNEIDILKDNIDFHLARGVDFIIATDNNSSDGTLELLKLYRDEGVLHLIEEPSDGYYQEAWVNRMAKIAYEEYEADIIFHNDADEFWSPDSSNLKVELLRYPAVDLIKVKAKNIILADKGGEEVYPDDAKYAVVKALEKKRGQKSRLMSSNNIYLNRPHRKVMFKTAKGLIKVRQGNHRYYDEKNEYVSTRSREITIYHFPSRGMPHFLRKTVEGGVAYGNSDDLKSNMGEHWREWYKAYENGRLEEQYRSMVLSDDDAQRLMGFGVVEMNSFNPRKTLKKTH